MALRVAAVDVGTNSTRLLVADFEGGSLKRVHAESRITRLGRGVDATGRLSEDAIETTLACLAAYSERMAAEGVERSVAVATSAARDADNSADFLARAAEAGTPVAILSGEDEAHLAFAGATSGEPAGEHLVVDVGGGSTELVVGAGGEVWAARSLDVGCVRLSERFLKHDPPTREELHGVTEEVREVAEPVAAELAPLPSEAIAVGGTATTIASIFLGLDSYDADVVDRTRLERDEAAAIRDRLAATPVAQIAAMPVMQPGRADVLVAGASILIAVIDTLGLAGITIRDRDILDGLALAAAGAVEGWLEPSG